MDMYDTVLSQYGVKKGLELYKEEEFTELMKESKKLPTMKTVDPLNTEYMTREQRQSALRYLMFFIKNRSGWIKAIRWADGSKKWEYMTKEETYNPTASTEDLILSCLMDTKEGRDVSTIDIPGAYMHADMKDEVNMKLEGKMADLFSEIHPQIYEEYITMENGKKVLYVRLKKSLYVTVQDDLLFFQNLTGKLKEWGFELNTYDTSVENKTIDGKNLQYYGMLITWIFIMLTVRLWTILSIHLMSNLVFMRHSRQPEEIITIILEWSLIIPLKEWLYLLCLIKSRMCWMSFRRYFMVMHWPLHATTYLPQTVTRIKWSPKNKKIFITMFPNYYTYPSRHDLISKLLCLISTSESRILI